MIQDWWHISDFKKNGEQLQVMDLHICMCWSFFGGSIDGSAWAAKSITWKLLSRLSTDEAANLRDLPQAAPRSFEHPGHNWTANPSRNEMDLEEWKLHLTGCFFYIFCNHDYIIAIVMINYECVYIPSQISRGPNLRLRADRLLNQNWTPRNYITCQYERSGPLTCYAYLHAKKHPPTVLPRAQHMGGSNPPKWKN